MGAKIRNAELSRIPIMIIIGEKEQKDNTVSIRRKFSGNQGVMKSEDFVKTIVEEITNRTNLILDS